jgi:hypothetical protein
VTLSVLDLLPEIPVEFEPFFWMDDVLGQKKK